MRILIVNSNSTASMTEKIAAVARQAAGPETEIIATNPPDGPPSIQGFYDGALCVPGLLAEIQRHPEADAIVIGCFDDTGLDAARSLVEVPVIGIGEAAFHAASFLCCKFSVVTTLRRSVPVIEANLLRYGLNTRCVRVRATDIPVLAFEQDAAGSYDRLAVEFRRSIDEDGTEAVVLGCAGMADLVKRLSDQFSLPVIDGVVCATTFAEALAASGLKTSKVGGYAHQDG